MWKVWMIQFLQFIKKRAQKRNYKEEWARQGSAYNLRWFERFALEEHLHQRGRDEKYDFFRFWPYIGLLHIVAVTSGANEIDSHIMDSQFDLLGYIRPYPHILISFKESWIRTHGTDTIRYKYEDMINPKQIGHKGTLRKCARIYAYYVCNAHQKSWLLRYVF